MSSRIKAFVAKLNHRRKSRLWRRRKSGQILEVDSGEEGIDLTEQMAGLELNSPTAESTAVAANPDIPYIFGKPNFKYDFELSSAHIPWPGPCYDESSQFAPGIFDKPRHPKRRPKQKSSKRRLSHEERPVTQRRHAHATPPTAKAIARTPKISQWPRYHGLPPPREPPVHLLNLPGEIRNEVYRLLFSDDSISAQFRKIIKPKHGLTRKAEFMRRFPQEPLLALCCKQLRQEVLSLFYSENKFVFHRSENPKLNGPHSTLTMTREENIRKWSPKEGLADSLRHVELHFRARDPTFKAFCITYTFRKLADGTIVASNSTDSIDYCTCFEDRMLQDVQAQLKLDGECKDLAEVAARLSYDRKIRLQSDASMSTDSPYLIYRPNKATCDDCGLETLREVGSGF